MWSLSKEKAEQKNMSKTLDFLGIDLGASSGRGIVGSFDGEKLSLREVHRFPNEPQMLNGRFTWDILRIFFNDKKFSFFAKIIIKNAKIFEIAPPRFPVKTNNN